MYKLIKTVLFSFVMLSPLGVKAELCNEQSKWWPICLGDSAEGPDVDSQEWINCRARGGCNYN